MEAYRCPDPEEQVYKPSNDTYLLTGSLLDSTEDLYGSKVVLDLGAGSGYIAEKICMGSMEPKSRQEILAIDISPCSIEYMRKHLPRECMERIFLVQCSGASCLREKSVDLVAINPPYLPVDERNTWLEISWSGGDRGVDTAIEMLGSVLEPLSNNGPVYMVLSSLGDLGLFEDKAKTLGFIYEIIAREKLFFEELVVYRLRKVREPRGEGSFSDFDQRLA